MLATRSLRFAAARYVNPAVCVWSPNIRIPPSLQLPSTPWYTKPLAVAYSKDVKSGEKNLTSDNPSPPSTSSTSIPKTSSPSASPSAKDVKTQTEKSYTGPIGETGVKLPSKDQIESFVFKSLVYLWDFSYYVFCLCRKLVETYVFNNSTVQYYWKQLLKRMEDARKELKSK